MANYTYFIMTPGADKRSYIQFPDNKRGNFIKFGDEVSNHGDLGIRNAYATHNPDIGVAAVMHSAAFQYPGLGTVIKNFIAGELKIAPVGHTEWFGILEVASWPLFNAMMDWDNKTVDYNNIDALKRVIRGFLTADNQITTFAPAALKDLREAPGT